MRKNLFVVTCFGVLSCLHTASAQDVLEVNFPTGTEGFVEVAYGVMGERCDTLPIVDARLVIAKDRNDLPEIVGLQYKKGRDDSNKAWMSVQINSARWGDFPIGYGRTVVTFDSIAFPLSVGTITDEYGDAEANDTFFHDRQRFRSKEFLKSHSQSLNALHLLPNSWDADTLQMALDCFSESLRNSQRGIELQQLISARKEETGVARLFPMWDTAGKARSFKECLNGKEYMLLGLWASWCGPCRAEIPELMDYYEHCRERVAFVSVTIDEDRDAWLKAVDELPRYEWPNLSPKFDGTQEGRSLPILLDNGFVPFFYILDHDGKTVYSSLEADGDEKPLDDAKRRLDALLTKSNRL